MAIRIVTASLDEVDFAEQLRAIRRALLIGLDSFGEIERLVDLTSSVELPKDIRPIHPTGSSDTIGVFANAFRLVDHLEPSFEIGKEATRD